jgi:hypothetical protein
MSETNNSELVSICVWSDAKRSIHFHITDVASENGIIERMFGLVEYQYCHLHNAWEGPHRDALLPLSEWSKLMSMSEHIDKYASSSSSSERRDGVAVDSTK